MDIQPAEAVAAGLSADVDLLIGTNSEEGNLYLAPVGKYSTSTDADVEAAAAASHPDPAKLVEVYRAARPEASPGALRSAIMGDALFGAGSRAMASAHAEHPSSGTYRYEFTWRSEALDGELGATHAMELPFVFDLAGLARLHGPNALLGPEKPPTDLAARVHEAWIRFAGTGDPGWAPYDNDRRTTMRMDAEWTEIDDPHSRERRASS